MIKEVIFQRVKNFIELQLTYLIDIFEDNHKIVRDRFVADSVNVMKNGPFLVKRHKQISIYINLAQLHKKPMEIFIRNRNTHNVSKPYWFVRNC